MKYMYILNCYFLNRVGNVFLSDYRIDLPKIKKKIRYETDRMLKGFTSLIVNYYVPCSYTVKLIKSCL